MARTDYRSPGDAGAGRRDQQLPPQARLRERTEPSLLEKDGHVHSTSEFFKCKPCDPQRATSLALPQPAGTGYTLGMKTAVSIPNELFEVAERLARRTRKSRSRLFSDALREYVARRSPDKITESMDHALAEIGENSDPFASLASRRRLERAEW